MPPGSGVLAGSGSRWLAVAQADKAATQTTAAAAAPMTVLMPVGRTADRPGCLFFRTVRALPARHRLVVPRETVRGSECHSTPSAIPLAIVRGLGVWPVG